MAYYYQNDQSRLPALSDVLPADILNAGRFSQFAPYSIGPQVKQEAYEPSLKGGIQSPYYNTPASPAWSSSTYESAPSPWSHGERTPSLSPSPRPLHAQLPRGATPQQQAPSVWISSVASPAPSQQSRPTQYSDLVWMPSNMDTPAGPQSRDLPRRPSQTTASGFAPGQQGGVVVECPPAKAHGVAHIAPGTLHPQVYIGGEAAALVARVARLPENQRGKLCFFRYAQGGPQ